MGNEEVKEVASTNSLVEETSKPRKSQISTINKYNMGEDIRRWRYEGNSFKKIVKLIQEKFNVTISYTALYRHCVRKGLVGDMSGERQRAVNSYQELLDSLGVVKQQLALNQALFEELESKVKTGDVDIKLYLAVDASNDKALKRQESLLKTITTQQALIYRYCVVSKFMDRIQSIIMEEYGLPAWNIIAKRCEDDFELRELLKKIPKEDVVRKISTSGHRKNEGKFAQQVGVSL